MSTTEHHLAGRMSSVPPDPFYPLFIIVASCFFTAVTIVQSLRQGKLSLPVTYDDIVYLSDALHRLQILYDEGIASLLKNLFIAPAHAPLSTLIPFIGFALFGVYDWAPAVVNVLWVALILGFVRLLLRDLPCWAYCAVAISVLAWPLTSAIVLEYRPDIIASLLTVMGCTLMFSSSFINASLRSVVVVAALFGLALITKPSISPLTLLIYLGSLSLSIIIDRWRFAGTPFLRRAARRVLLSFTIVMIIALPYFIFAWRDVYNYIYVTTIGEGREQWIAKLSVLDTVGYYLWGIGGRTMMGPWFWMTLVLTALSFVAMRRVSLRKLALATIFLGAYAAVSIPGNKSPFLGVIVPMFFLAFFVLASGDIIKTLLRLKVYGRWAAIGFAVALLVISASTFQWHWQNQFGIAYATQVDLMAPGRYVVIRRVGDYFESHAGEYTKDEIFFPVNTNYFNKDILQFELQKRRLRQAEALPIALSLEEQRDALAKADHVVVFDADDPEVLSGPDAVLYGKVRPLIVSSPSFEKRLEIPTADRNHKIFIYARVPSRDFRLHPISAKDTNPK